MSKCMVVVLAIGALVLATTAFAAPVTLSSDQLDKVAAGSGILDLFLGDVPTTDASAESDEEEELTVEVEASIPVAVGDGAIAVSGTDNETVGAHADNGSGAVNGDDNVNVVVDIPGNIAALGSAAGDNNRVNNVDAVYALTTGDNASIQLVYAEAGSSAFIGDNNTVTIDNTYVEGEIEEGGIGVIAREANVSNSFNYEEVNLDVDVNIEKSFNVSSECLDISGQDSIQSIVNAANVGGDQMVGVTLNVTSATATMPTSQNEDSANVPIIAGNALALAVLKQTVVNGSLIVVVPVGVAVGTTAADAL